VRTAVRYPVRPAWTGSLLGARAVGCVCRRGVLGTLSLTPAVFSSHRGMNDNRIRSVVIVGGGTAGWMAAASLSHYFAKNGLSITLIASTDIPTVGVREATIPALRDYDRAPGIDELVSVRAPPAAARPGSVFEDWARVGTSFMHPFGLFGAPARDVPFHQYWLKLRHAGDRADFGDYSFAIELARQNRFTRPHPKPDTPLGVFDWALH